MDSRSSFAIILVLAGLAGMWLLIEGYVQKFVTAARAKTAAPATSSSTSSATSPATAAGKASTAPLTEQQIMDSLYPFGKPGDMTIPSTPAIDPHLTLGSAALAFQTVLGGDGIAVEPIGGVRVLGAA